MAREFIMPNQIISGIGALELAEDTLGKLGKKALIVTDMMMLQLGNCEKLEQALKNKGVEYVIYSEINGEPTDVMLVDGISLFKKESCDFLVALGGGSPIDAMKAIAAMIDRDDKISSYMGKEIVGKLPSMVAIPTTAGTGSEVTQFTIISDTEKGVKMLLRGKVLMPNVAIIDPQFTMTAPPKITAATGLDALCHAVEAYTSKKSQKMSDTFAISAVKRILEYLPIVYKEGNNEAAREQMSLAALEAGVAFNNSSVTLIHGMSRPIGALFHIAHGLSNAMLIKVCLNFALPGAYEKFAELGRSVKVASVTDSDEVAGRKFLDKVEELVVMLEAPTLEEYGVNKEEFSSMISKMASDAMISGSPQNTQREITQSDIEELYKELW
ncbi:MAG: iron-containing alcohol dehydrogenase [Eubacteriales bacterium]